MNPHLEEGEGVGRTGASLPLWRVIKNARRYELACLVRALEQAGVPARRISFDSRRLTRGKRQDLANDSPKLAPSLRVVERARVRWVEEEPHVTVYLNAGLFGPRSPLPSYFQRLLKRQDVGSFLGELLHVLDDSLVRARALHGDTARRLKPHAPLDEALNEAVFGTSILSVDWLFRQIFPELGVEVRRGEELLTLGMARVALGAAVLGSCALDGRATVTRRSLDVTLTVTHPRLSSATRRGEGDDGLREPDWTDEVWVRLRNYVLPRLSRFPLALRVRLRMLVGGEQAGVNRARVTEAQVVEARAPLEFTIYAGHPGRTASSSL